MITVQLITMRHVPPFAEVTLRTSLDGPGEGFSVDVPGRYETDRWSFELTDLKYQAGFNCKFLLNRQTWAEGGNLLIPGQDGQTHSFYLSTIGFQRPTQPVIEQGSVHTRLFDLSPPSDADHVFDVIVVGSGMAGGVLADRLSDNRIDTLVLEAGGVPLETHIANLPRRHQRGFGKHVWERWPEYQVVNYDAPGDGNVYNGAQAFNLGGRSVFWGGFIPRMSSWELDFWPKRIKWDLEDRYYQLAEDVMGRSTAPVTQYLRSVHRALRRLLPNYTHFDAPVAVRKNLADDNTISSGMFSTADLLLETFRTPGPLGSEYLSIRTHAKAIRVEPDATAPTVVVEDLVGRGERRFRGRFVVLACGCLESARLARRSDLGGDLVGQGVSDHPIAYSHFSIPPASLYYDRYGAVKVVSQPNEPRPDSGAVRDPFNVLIELGADFNQGRYLDEDIFAEAVSKQEMLCEIVFLSNRELVLTNRIDFDAGNDFRPVPRVLNPGLSDAVKARVATITKIVLDELQGKVLTDGDGNPDAGDGGGGLGGVAHEVGSLRMRVQDSNNVEKGAQQPLDGVVDEYGKFLDQESIYACDLSIFPTSPAANPSLTAVALSIRLADRLTQLLSSL